MTEGEETGRAGGDPGRPPWLDRRLFPFRSRFVEVEGCRVHYVDEGEGPTLLMLHGNPTWSFLYRDVIGDLRGRFRCVALDYPGFGLSSARDGYGFTPAEHARVVEGFLLALDLSGVTLMVQDWGGPIGLGVAARHPGRFRALAIGNTWAWPVGGLRYRVFSGLAGGPVGHVLIRRFNAFVNVLVPVGVSRGRVSREVMRHYRGPFPTPASREPTYVFPREILGSGPFLREVEEGLQRISDLPALILWGDGDPAFGEAQRVRFEAVFPNHRTVILRGAGHFIQEDAPHEISYAIAHHLPRMTAGEA